MNKKDKKKPSKLQITAAIVIAVVFVFGLSSGDKSDDSKVVSRNTSSEVKEEKTVFKKDDIIAFDDKEVTVSNVERNWSHSEYFQPSSGKMYVKVLVTIKNNSKNRISYNTFDWKIQDSKGNIESVTMVSFGADNALSSGELAAGGEKSGFLVFEVLDDGGELTLLYEPSFWSSKKLEIKI